MFVIGEVMNNTAASLTWVNVSVNFYDSGDNLVGTGSTYMWPLDLPARTRGCFKISMNVPTNWSHYEFETLVYYSSETSPNLAIINDSGAYDAIDGDYAIIGQAKNNGTQRSMAVSVGGTLYNSDGVPVGCEYDTVNSNDLDPGQVSAFNINYSGYYRNYSDVTYYKLRVAGEIPGKEKILPKR